MSITMCIQNLGKYNEGELWFKWLPLPATEKEISDALSEIHICHTDENGNYVEFTDEFGSPYEEIHMPDWECDFDGLEYNEWWSIDELNEIAKRLDNLSEYELHWLEAYMLDTSESFENALDNYEDRSRYWDGMSKSEVAREIADEYMEGMIPRQTGYGCDDRTKKALEWLQEYFDYDAYERSLDLDEIGFGVIKTW